MKIPVLLTMMLVTYGVAQADLGPGVPGTGAVKPVFDKADLVCKCSVVSLSNSEERSFDTNGNLAVKFRVKASLRIEDTYKSTAPGDESATLEYLHDPQTQTPSVRDGQTFLLFLNRLSTGTYTFADTFIGATLFTALHQESGEPNLGKLQSALVATALQQDRGDSIRALRLLLGFDQLAAESLLSLRSVALANDPFLAAPAVAVLLHAKSPGSVGALKRFSDEYTAASEPIDLINIEPELAEITDVADLPDLEALATSKFIAIRLGAMRALRHIKNRGSIPALVGRLDDPNMEVEYLAVISLAEIVGKYDGDYAPGMGPFDKNPSLYTGNWKNWWAQQPTRTR